MGFKNALARLSRSGKCVLLLVVASCFATVSRAAAEEFPAIAKFAGWSVFVSDTTRPKACWAATQVFFDEDRQRAYLLAVTQFGTRPNPQLSIFSNKRLPRSAGLFLNVGGRDYRLQSDGVNAWLSKRQDRTLLKQLQAEARHSGFVTVGIKGFTSTQVPLFGFNDALDRALKECDRS